MNKSKQCSLIKQEQESKQCTLIKYEQNQIKSKQCTMIKHEQEKTMYIDKTWTRVNNVHW